MKFLLILFAFFQLQTLNAHEYYFSFAEVEYNEMQQRFEATIIATAHDIEKSYFHDEINLDKADGDRVAMKKIETLINKHLKIKSNGAIAYFKLIGLEVDFNGSVNFYIESETIKTNNEISVQFDLLMDHYPAQQNKITLINRNQSQTIPFTQEKRNQILYINNKK